MDGEKLLDKVFDDVISNSVAFLREEKARISNIKSSNGLLKSSIRNLFQKYNILESTYSEQLKQVLEFQAATMSNKVQRKDIPTEGLKNRLVEFYSKHNPDKVDQVDSVIKHFSNRLHALNDALMIQYGESIEEFVDVDLSAAAEDGTETDQDRMNKEQLIISKHALMLNKLQLEHLDKLLQVMKLDYFLPKYNYKIRLNANDNNGNLVGINDLFVDSIDGLLRVDIHRTSQLNLNNKTGVPEFIIKTVKPVKLKLRIFDLCIVRNLALSDVEKATINKFESLSLISEVVFNLSFIQSNESLKWVAAPSFNFSIVKLKNNDSYSTSMMPAAMIDSLLKLVANSMLSALIKRQLERLLLPEIGKALSDKSLKHKTGFAGELKVSLMGIPQLKYLQCDLSSPGNMLAKVLRFLNLDERQLAVLRQLQRYLSNMAVKRKLSRELLVFPVKDFNLEGLLALFRRLHNHELNKDKAFLAVVDRLVASIQLAIDELCVLKRDPGSSQPLRLDFRQLMVAMELISHKELSFELDAKGVDFCIDGDKLLHVVQSALWKSAKRMSKSTNTADYGATLQRVHRVCSIVKFSLDVFKDFSKHIVLLATGAFSGGNQSSFEFAINDFVHQGVLDIQLENFRFGGQLEHASSWLSGLVEKLLTLVPANKDKQLRFLKQQQTLDQLPKNLSTAQDILLDHVESLDFFLALSVQVNKSNNLVLRLSGRKGSPRLPLHFKTKFSISELFPAAPGDDDEAERRHELRRQQAVQLSGRTFETCSERLSHGGGLPLQLLGAQLAHFPFGSVEHTLLLLLPESGPEVKEAQLTLLFLLAAEVRGEVELPVEQDAASAATDESMVFTDDGFDLDEEEDDEEELELTAIDSFHDQAHRGSDAEGDVTDGTASASEGSED